MSPEQIAGAVVATLLAVSGGLGYRVIKKGPELETVEDAQHTTDVLLSRIGELETALAAEKARASQLEAEVAQLRHERRELASRVSHLEGQVQTLSDLVTKLVERA